MSELLIVPYRAEYAGDFSRLNREWLERYFSVEPLDAKYLNDPEGQVVRPGGEIFFAVEGGVVVGTCAAIPHGDGEFELAKLAVTPAAQGRGIGQLLAVSVLEFARSRGAAQVVLVSNSSLTSALRLYERLGFAHRPLVGDRPYIDADVSMVLHLEPSCSLRLRAALAASEPLLRKISETDSAKPRAPGKWSPRQVIGHLIDSASNNHGRFLRGATQEGLTFPGYAQEDWVALGRYQDAPWSELLELWLAFNRQIARVMAAIPEAARLRVHAKHNLEEIATHAPKRPEDVTLDYFMLDYVDHLEMHLRQILGDDFRSAWRASGAVR